MRTTHIRMTSHCGGIIRVVCYTTRKLMEMTEEQIEAMFPEGYLMDGWCDKHGKIKYHWR